MFITISSKKLDTSDKKDKIEHYGKKFVKNLINSNSNKRNYFTGNSKFQFFSKKDQPSTNQVKF